MARNDKKEQRRAWPTGELTMDVIKKDVQTRLLPGAIGFTVATVLFCVGLVPMLTETTDITLKVAAVMVGLAYCAVMAYRKWTTVLIKREYRIEEDKVLAKRIEADILKEDARQSDMTTRIPILEFEKHGTYQIDAEQIHDYYIPLQLVHDFQEAEEVYMVYDKKTGKLLRIYRKKYWKMA